MKVEILAPAARQAGSGSLGEPVEVEIEHSCFTSPHKVQEPSTSSSSVLQMSMENPMDATTTPPQQQDHARDDEVSAVNVIVVDPAVPKPNCTSSSSVLQVAMENPMDATSTPPQQHEEGMSDMSDGATRSAYSCHICGKNYSTNDKGYDWIGCKQADFCNSWACRKCLGWTVASARSKKSVYVCDLCK
jgi:hypothetical protein